MTRLRVTWGLAVFGCFALYALVAGGLTLYPVLSPAVHYPRHGGAGTYNLVEPYGCVVAANTADLIASGCAACAAITGRSDARCPEPPRCLQTRGVCCVEVQVKCLVGKADVHR